MKRRGFFRTIFGVAAAVVTGGAAAARKLEKPTEPVSSFRLLDLPPGSTIRIPATATTFSANVGYVEVTAEWLGQIT